MLGKTWNSENRNEDIWKNTPEDVDSIIVPLDPQTSELACLFLIIASIPTVMDSTREASPPQTGAPIKNFPPPLPVLMLINRIKSQHNPTGDILTLIKKKRDYTSKEV